MAEAATIHTSKRPPPLTPIGQALDCLHDATSEPIVAPSSLRRYDAKMLDHLRNRMIDEGMRLRGRLDRGRPQWIEPDELSDYVFEYRNFLIAGRGIVPIVVAVSQSSYPASEVKDRSVEVRRHDTVEPSYRLVIRDLKVETESLLQSLDVATSNKKRPKENESRKALPRALEPKVQKYLNSLPPCTEVEARRAAEESFNVSINRDRFRKHFKWNKRRVGRPSEGK
jgi:hypothetical protein